MFLTRTLKMKQTIFVAMWTLAQIASVASFWNDEITPRLRVNYLSQSNGKNWIFFIIFHLCCWCLMINEANMSERILCNFFECYSCQSFFYGWKFTLKGIFELFFWQLNFFTSGIEAWRQFDLQKCVENRPLITASLNFILQRLEVNLV